MFNIKRQNVVALFVCLASVLACAQPAFVSYTDTSWTTSGSSKTSATVSWQAGDVIVVIGGAENGATLGNPTATGLTFIQQRRNTASNTCASILSTAIPSVSGSGTIRMTNSSSSIHWGFAVEVWRGAAGVGTTAEQHTTSKTVSLAPLVADSAIVWSTFDWSAGSLQAVTPTPTSSNRKLVDSGRYTIYASYLGDQVSTGATLYGISGSGSGPFSNLAVEIKGNGAPPPPPAVTITPTSASIFTSAQQQFTANVAVNWSASGGTVTASGLYTAPGSAGNFTVTATSQTDVSNFATAAVTVTAPPPPGNTELANAVAALIPGQWTRFTAAENTSWQGGTILNAGPRRVANDNLTTWSNKAFWNIPTAEFYFVGGGHCGDGSCPDEAGVVRYTESTNTWATTIYFDGAHAYEGTALKSPGIYIRPYNSNEIQNFSITQQAFTANLPNAPYPVKDCCNAMEYFPDRDSLITIDNDEGIYEYSFATGQWSGCLVNTLVAGDCHGASTAQLCSVHTTAAPWARYDAVGHRLLFGGCTKVWALSPVLGITALPAAPFDLSVGPSGSPVTISPSSGNLMTWNSSGLQFIGTDSSWTGAGQSPFTDPLNGGVVCAPVPAYSVVMCLYAGTNGLISSGGTVWLYKQ
jgi:hypothetical protein